MSGQRLGERVSQTVELEKPFEKLMEGTFASQSQRSQNGWKGPLISSLRLMLSQAQSDLRECEFPSFSLRHCAVRICHTNAICGS